MKYKLEVYVQGKDEPLTGEIDEKTANDIIFRIKSTGFDFDFMFPTEPSLMFIRSSELRFLTITPIYTEE